MTQLEAKQAVNNGITVTHPFLDGVWVKKGGYGNILINAQTYQELPLFFEGLPGPGWQTGWRKVPKKDIKIGRILVTTSPPKVVEN